jgi:hypothetical protein
MKRLIRWLFNVIAAVSLLLCMATIVFWIDSYSVQRVVMWNGGIDYEAVSNNGVLRFAQWIWLVPIHGKWHRQTYNPDGVFSSETRPYWGMQDLAPVFVARRDISLNGSRHPFGDGIEEQRWVLFPHWFLALLLILPTGLRLYYFRRKSHSADGMLCIQCRYDLRATPDRCPECGTIPPRQKITSN